MNLFSIWLKELKSFFQYDAKNWTFLVFQYDSKNWTFFQNAQGIEPLFLMNYFFTWLELNSFLINTTQRVKVFHKKWLKVSNTFLNLTERVEPCLHWTQRIEPFFWSEKDSQNWTLLFTDRSEPFFSLTGVEPFFSTWLKEWIFFWLTQKIEPCVKRKVSKSGTFFWFWSKELFPFFFNLTRRIEPFFSICLNELNLFLENDPQNWTFFQYVCKYSELFKYDSLNWTFFCKKMSQKWLNELNLLVMRLTELKLRLDT